MYVICEVNANTNLKDLLYIIFIFLQIQVVQILWTLLKSIFNAMPYITFLSSLASVNVTLHVVYQAPFWCYSTCFDKYEFTKVYISLKVNQIQAWSFCHSIWHETIFCTAAMLNWLNNAKKNDNPILPFKISANYTFDSFGQYLWDVYSNSIPFWFKNIWLNILNNLINCLKVFNWI